MFTNSRGATLVAMTFVAFACSKPTSQPPLPGVTQPEVGASFDKQKVLAAFGACALDTYRAFESAATKLQSAADTAKSEPTDANRKAALAAWSAAIDVWEQAEMMQFGPLGPRSEGNPGGEALRDNIYGWPLFGRCPVDQLTVAKSYETPDFFVGALVNTRGLAAVEYLLGYDGADNGCAATATINSSGSWAAMTTEDRVARKNAFASVLVQDVTSQARSLVEAWDPAKGDFVGKLATAGKGSSVYATDQLAFNAVSDGLFYLDSATKDQKLAVPLAIDTKKQCAAVCPERLESPYAKRSKEHLRNNLIGFRKLFEGCGDGFAGLGFDDYLEAIGAGSVAKEMKADLVNAIAVVDAYPYATLDEGLLKDPPAVQKIHDAIKAITDALKTEFVSVLVLKIPQSAAGDAD